MKKPAKKPLQLDTATVRRLSEQELGRVVGGSPTGQTHTCSCQGGYGL
jgi:hypothetical protein